jgi:hypothetical protein
VALGLAGEDDGVERTQKLHQLVVPPAADLGAEHGVRLRPRIVPLDLKGRRYLARDRVEEHRVLDRRHERMADAAQHRVVRPDLEPVAPSRLEGADVLDEVFLLCRVGGTQDPVLDVLHRHGRVRRWMPPVRVDQPRGVEHLQRVVRVERGHDLRYHAEISVDELAQAPVVVGCAGHEQLEPRCAERVLAVDEQQADPWLVVASGCDPVLGRPGGRSGSAFLVRHPPDLGDRLGIPMRR